MTSGTSAALKGNSTADSYDAGRLREFDRLLRRRFGVRRLWNRRRALDELIFILLSAQTEEYNYRRTYRSLRRRYRTWERALAAGPERIAEAITSGGLASKKGTQIHALLTLLAAEYGRLDLEFLRGMSTEEVMVLLTRLPGVGVKTARCVALYSLDRAVFPVDTHVWRVMGRFRGESRERAPSVGEQEATEASVAADLRYSLHVNLVQLGRQVCQAKAPRCGECPGSALCRSAVTGASRARSTQVTTALSSMAIVAPPSANPDSDRRVTSQSVPAPAGWQTATRAVPRRAATRAQSI